MALDNGDEEVTAVLKNLAQNSKSRQQMAHYKRMFSYPDRKQTDFKVTDFIPDLAAERRQPTNTSRQTLVEINNNANEQNKSQARKSTASDAKQKAKEHLIADVYHFVKNDSNVMDTLKEYSTEKQQRRSTKNKPRQSLAKRKLEMELLSSDSDTVASQVKAVHTPPDSLINSKKYDDTTLAHQEEVSMIFNSMAKQTKDRLVRRHVMNTLTNSGRKSTPAKLVDFDNVDEVNEMRRKQQTRLDTIAEQRLLKDQMNQLSPQSLQVTDNRTDSYLKSPKTRQQNKNKDNRSLSTSQSDEHDEVNVKHSKKQLTIRHDDDDDDETEDRIQHESSKAKANTSTHRRRVIDLYDDDDDEPISSHQPNSEEIMPSSFHVQDSDDQDHVLVIDESARQIPNESRIKSKTPSRNTIIEDDEDDEQENEEPIQTSRTNAKDTSKRLQRSRIKSMAVESTDDDDEHSNIPEPKQTTTKTTAPAPLSSSSEICIKKIDANAQVQEQPKAAGFTIILPSTHDDDHKKSKLNRSGVQALRTTKIGAKALFNDDSKDETELLLSQSNRFLRKSTRTSNFTDMSANVTSSSAIPAGLSSSSSMQHSVKAKRADRRSDDNKSTNKVTPTIVSHQPNETRSSTTTRKSLEGQVESNANHQNDDLVHHVDNDLVDLTQDTDNESDHVKIADKRPKVLQTNSKTSKKVEQKGEKQKKKARKAKKHVDQSPRVDQPQQQHDNHGDVDVDMGVRRSRRTRVPRGQKPIYQAEYIQDCDGKRTKVYAIAGFEKSKSIREEYSKNLWCGGSNGVRKQNVFVRPIVQSLKTVVDDRHAEQANSRKRRIKPMETDSDTDQSNSSPEVNQKKKNDQAHAKKQKNQQEPVVAVAEHSNQSLRFDDDVDVFDDNAQQDENNNRTNEDINNNNNKEPVAKQSNAKELIVSESYMDLAGNDDYNCLNETTWLNDGKTKRSIIRFARECDNKDYIELKTGVHVRATDDRKGVMRVDKQEQTISNQHDTDIDYYVMRGFVVIALNKTKHLLKCGDFITIPTLHSYEIINSSKTMDAYLSFSF